MADTPTVEVLSLGYAEPPIECSKERWFAALKNFQPRARQHAANLAAHNWDVLLIGERVFLFQSKYGGERGHWLNHDGTREDATSKEQARLYTPAKIRRFRTKGVEHDQHS